MLVISSVKFFHSLDKIYLLQEWIALLARIVRAVVLLSLKTLVLEHDIIDLASLDLLLEIFKFNLVEVWCFLLDDVVILKWLLALKDMELIALKALFWIFSFVIDFCRIWKVLFTVVLFRRLFDESISS